MKIIELNIFLYYVIFKNQKGTKNFLENFFMFLQGSKEKQGGD